ncbi:hypothetical protein SAMN02910409_0868 [Prevotellaceae bacterium HUN156]|nr:hypothetical protein SAMN02910409_0868 [Prevotellaceae bacterium HUN156]
MNDNIEKTGEQLAQEATAPSVTPVLLRLDGCRITAACDRIILKSCDHTGHVIYALAPFRNPTSLLYFRSPLGGTPI